MMPNSMNRTTGTVMTARNWFDLFLLGMLWGGAFFFAKIAVAEIHPLMLVFLRVFLAAIALHAVLMIMGNPLVGNIRLWFRLLILAVLNNLIPYSLIFSGQTVLSAGLASVINATTPFWTMIAAQILTQDEKLNSGKLIGIMLGVAGVVVMVGPSVFSGLGGPVWAKFAVLGATISYAFAALYARNFKGLAPIHLATGQLTAACFAMLPIAILVPVSVPFAQISLNAWSSVLALALASTAFAYFLYFRIISTAGATNATLVTLLIPASALLLGAIFLGETLEVFELFGFALIISGLLTIDGRLFIRR